MKIANAPCSWGVLEFDLPGEPLDYPQVLNEMQVIGYSGTELGDWGFLPTDSEKLRAELKERELTLVAAFLPIPFADRYTHAWGKARAVQHARLLVAAGFDNAFIVLSDHNGSVEERWKNAGRIRPEHGLTKKQWRTFVKGVHRIARAVKDEMGLRTVFHHHCAGYVETPDELDTLMKRTDPELVGLCIDTGHYRFGGGNPLDIFEKHGERIWHVHFKDCDPEIVAQVLKEDLSYFNAINSGVFCELGKGDVDFPAFIAELRKRNYDGWIVVEQDVLPEMGTPYESAKRNFNYLKSIGL